MAAANIKLTKRAVDAAAPQVGRYVVWDAELKGFALRVAPSGTKTYILRYRPRGLGSAAPKRFIVIGRHGPLIPDEVRARARALLGRVAAGGDPAKEEVRPAEGITVAKLVDLFITEHVQAKRNAATARGYAAAARRSC